MIDGLTVILCTVYMTVPLLASLIILIRGKLKLKNVTAPTEFYPPEDFSPIDVMTEFYADKSNPKKLLNPLMLYWADRGYIKIESDCRRGLRLTKLKDLEMPQKGGEERLETFRSERDLFKKLFGSGNVFYTLAAQSSYKEAYDGFVKDVAAIAKKVKPKKWKLIEAVISAFSVIATVLATVMIGVELDNSACVAMLFPVVGLIIIRFVPLGMFKYLFFGVWGGAPMGAALFSVPSECAVILLCSVICSFVTQYVFLPLADVREERNLKIYARLKGFKRFLTHAEKPQLEMLAEENPDYYFNVLPYCYIFGITKKVRARFDKIRLDGPAPYLESGEFGDYRDVLMF